MGTYGIWRTEPDLLFWEQSVKSGTGMVQGLSRRCRRLYCPCYPRFRRSPTRDSGPTCFPFCCGCSSRRGCPTQRTAGAGVPMVTMRRGPSLSQPAPQPMSTAMPCPAPQWREWHTSLRTCIGTNPHQNRKLPVCFSDSFFASAGAEGSCSESSSKMTQRLRQGKKGRTVRCEININQ